MTNIVIYARYSSNNQTEKSIEGQLRICREYAKKNDFIVIKEYIDRAKSGTTDNRPALQEMVRDAANGHFKYVLVYQFDRFFRKIRFSRNYKDTLKKHGVRVISALENIPSDPTGIIIESFYESWAEYYSADLAQKVKRGMDQNASKCLSTGGNVALGFRVDENKNFKIDEEKAHIVRTIFKIYAEDTTMAEIIRYLNRMQLKTSRGNEYNKNSIRRILTNKRYKGIYTYCDTEIENGIPRIVSDELFDKVQLKINKNQKAPARSKAKAKYILTTKMFCGHCDSQMTGISGVGKGKKTYHYYTCVKARRKECDKKSINKDYIEDLVVTETKKLLTTKRVNMIARAVVNFSKQASGTTELKRLKHLLSDNTKAIKNLITALEQGQASDIVMEQLQKRQQEKQELEKEIAKESIKYPALDINEVKFFLHQLKQGDVTDMKYRQALVDLLVNSIYLYDDKMTILYNTQDGQSTFPLEQKCSSNGQLVEARGVEPLSESPKIESSPGAA